MTKYGVGNVNDEPAIDPKKENRWLEGGRKKIEDCASKDCVLLPICAGGCAAQALSEEGDLSGYSCFRAVENVEEYLKIYATYSMGINAYRESAYTPD
jgi:sulfatase maturation enzyme AslB (radical SAM superfamily)